MKPAIVFATMLLTVAAAMAAEPVTLRVSKGLPQVSQIAGEPYAFRYVTARADAALWGVETRLSECIDASGAALRPFTAPTAAGRSSGCTGGSAGTGPDPASRQLVARLRTPRYASSVPIVELALRNWRSAASGSRPSQGSEAEVELTQPFGSAKAFAGRSIPLGSVTPGDGWRTSYAGIKWVPQAGNSIEVSADRSRRIDGAALEREATLTYSRSIGRSARFRFSATRAADNRVEPWRSGLGLDWVF